MKTILIEHVSNGWIVRPFDPCANWACSDRQAMAVFTKMDDLQKALPELLQGREWKVPPPKIESPPQCGPTK